MKTRFLLIIVFFISIYSFAQTNVQGFRHLTVNQGLPHTDATGLVQDEMGYIWISTYAGLNRFDGYEIKNFISKNYQLDNAYLNRINDVYYENQKIWLATQGGIAFFNCRNEEIIVPKFDKEVSNLSFQQVLVSNHIIYGIVEGKVLRFKYDGQKATLINETLPLPYVLNSTIDPHGNVLFGTVKGLYILKKNILKKIQFSENQFSNISFSHVSFDKSGIMQIGFAKGFGIVAKYAMGSQPLSIEYHAFSFNLSDTFDSKNSSISSIQKDTNNDYWIGTPIGLKKFDSVNKKFVEPNFINTLSSSHINKIIIDKSGTLWLSTFGGGVNYIDLTPKKFQTLRFNEPKLNYIRAIYEDSSDGTLWIGTRTEGLIHYDFKRNTSQVYKIENGLTSNYIRCIVKDKKGRVWVGTEKGITILKDNQIIKTIKNSGISNSDPLTNNVIYALDVDVFGQVWAGSWHNGLNRIVEKGNNFEIQKIYQDKLGLSNPKVSFIFADPNRPEVFIGTAKGLNHFFLNQDGTLGKVNQYLGKPNDPSSISSNFIWPIIRENQSTLWVGTIGGGLNKITLLKNGGYESQSITTAEGLPSNDVESILQDNDGNIWIGGKGLSMFDPKTGKIIKYDDKDGLQSNIFKIGSSFKGRDGRLYFGGVNGLNYFYPTEIKQSAYISPVVFSDILINNSTAKVSEKELPESISFLNKITLNHNQNNLIIKFASLDFANAEKCSYRYKLVGFNKDWVVTDSKSRFASFSNLDFGNYVLLLQSTNHDGVWMNEVKKLNIVITPPWWKSTIAKIIYLLIIGAVVYIIYGYQLNLLKLNQKLEIKEIEKTKEDELHQLRMQFFTNISHELRTPLSLILSPTEKLLHEELDKEHKIRLLSLIQRNGIRLMNLVNELLDFRKAEAGMMKLKTREIDLLKYIREIAEEFDELAIEKNILFEKHLGNTPIKLWIDQNVFGKVIVNLLSNAFKYTPENYKILVELTDNIELKFKNIYQEGVQNLDLEYQWIRVLDNGIGIQTESLNHVFERFYRVTEEDKDTLPGSGIGLAFVRSLVLVHKGVIMASSEAGKGTEFLIGIPKGNSHLNKDEIYSSKDYNLDDSAIQAIETKQFLIEELENRPFAYKEDDSELRKPKLLVVEDNDELRHFIRDSFMEQYQVIEACDGEEGIEKLKDEFPDIVISDVMMPKMDGFELCKTIKSDIEVSHTPVILLTAKNSDESKISGGEVGADSYITKPFSLKLLQLTIQNILENRKRLKDMYANDIFIEAREMGTTKRDKEFIDFLISIVERNIDNTNLDVELICNEAGMSRTKLYSKIQNLTGQPVGEFIRKIRLKKAAQIIVSEDVSIVEVMERVGIQSQSYFTKAFKKEFGKTPTKFLHDYIVEKEMFKN